MYQESSFDLFATRYSDAEPEILQQLYRETWLKVLNPRMASGHLQGRILSLISKMQRPKRVLEIGTFTGYSTLCLAEGLPQDGHIITLEEDEELETLATKYFALAGKSDAITMKIGKAAELIPTLQQQWDLVFLDADKISYPLYFELLKDSIAPNGLLIADNVWWNGKVAEPAAKHDATTKAVIDYCEKVTQDVSFESTLLPVRDGLLISRKKAA